MKIQKITCISLILVYFITDRKITKINHMEWPLSWHPVRLKQCENN